MGKTILSILEFVRESLPYSLIDKEGYARLAAVAERLPAEMTTFWGFECRLGQSDAKADILFQTINKSQGQRLLAGHTPSPLDIICDRWPAWRRLRTFAGLWSDPNHPLHAYIHNIWLEFDTASTSSVTQVTDVIAKPSIFFGPKAKALDCSIGGKLS